MEAQTMKQHARPVLCEDEEADMGVGTMIVFIAMVLVAGVAASVLINVANDLQQQAQNTASQAIANVATGFIVHSVVGDRGSSTNETITFLEITVSLQAGSPNIAMENVIIDISDESNTATLTFSTTTTWMKQWNAKTSTFSTYLKNSAAATTYTADELRDPSSTFYTPSSDTDNPDFVVSQGVLLKIYIDAADASVTISPQNTVSLTLSPQNGAPTHEVFTAPESFADRYVPLA